MGSEGRALGRPDAGQAPIDLGQLAQRFSDLKEVAMTFGDAATADKAALEFGWSVKDDDGTPNHRCPDCKRKRESYESRYERTGAYIEWGFILVPDPAKQSGNRPRRLQERAKGSAAK